MIKWIVWLAVERFEGGIVADKLRNHLLHLAHQSFFVASQERIQKQSAAIIDLVMVVLPYLGNIDFRDR